METSKHEYVLDCGHEIATNKPLQQDKYITYVRCPACREPDTPHANSSWQRVSNGLRPMRNVPERTPVLVQWYEVLGFLKTNPDGRGYKYLKSVVKWK